MSWNKKQILEFAKYIKTNKANNIVKLNGKNYSLASVTQVLCNFIIDNTKTDYPSASIKLPTNPTGDNVNVNITKISYTDAIKRCYTYQKNTGKAPNYVRVSSKYNIKYQLFAYAVAKIVVFIFENNSKYPNYVTVNSKDIEPILPEDEVYDYFCKVFNKKPQTIDDALQIVNGKGYGYYYDDKFSNKQTIDNLAKKGASKPNCTDSCHTFWHIGKALGYEVRAVHVKCRGGDGHVRLQFKHPKNTRGEWINRDPACVISANGKPITCNWCLDGTVLAYNPQWFMNNLNR